MKPEKRIKCTACKGTGGRPWTSPDSICPVCDGSGRAYPSALKRHYAQRGTRPLIYALADAIVERGTK